jgi:hypothetical protein
LGRGGRSNHHAGNERFRELIRKNRPLYNDLPKHEKIKMSRAIVRAIEELGGRFLEPDRDGQSLYLFVAPHKRAVEKTSQCLREKRADRLQVGPLKSIAPATASIMAAAGTTTTANNKNNKNNNNNNNDDNDDDNDTLNSSQQVGTTSKAA